jgi:hypothetical protein
MDFKLTVTYAAGHSQEHPGLSAEQLETGTGAFLRDLLNLEGRGITRLVAEIDGGEPTWNAGRWTGKQPEEVVAILEERLAAANRAVGLLRAGARDIAGGDYANTPARTFARRMLADTDAWEGER